MWTNPALINAVILGILTIITLVLNRRFSRKDTVTTIMVAEMKRLRAEQNWQRRVINVLDAEVWNARQTMAAAGMKLEPRPEWPTRPEESLPDLTPAGEKR